MYVHLISACLFFADIWRTRCNSMSEADKDCIFISFQTDIKLPSWRIGELWQQFLTKQGQWLDEGYWTIICQQYFYLLYKAREGCISTTIRSGRSSKKTPNLAKCWLDQIRAENQRSHSRNPWKASQKVKAGRLRMIQLFAWHSLCRQEVAVGVWSHIFEEKFMSNLKKIFLVKLKGHFWVGMFSRLKLTKHVPGKVGWQPSKWFPGKVDDGSPLQHIPGRKGKSWAAEACRWQCGSVEPMAAAISAGSCSRAPQCGVHTDVQCSSAIDCEQNSAKMSELPYYLLWIL